ncbi:hypothetical protein BJX66DRAFT_305340 [Aspergillus keveii]|uniref:Zn(2)-C6 fungal-type domain-containing protein n=1 Tax=Aspergillus keveii TaxID=714993 RepID=A0ABR4G406_9EURO
MVYCGRPSKGCLSCRTRKIRCDQTRPACSECVKCGWVCPGYRDTLSLMFRDESQRVIQKATTAAQRNKLKKAMRPETSASQSPPSSSESSGESSISLQASLTNTTNRQVEEVTGQLQPQMLQPSHQPTENEAISWFLRYNAWPGALFMIGFDQDLLDQPNMPLSEQACRSSIVSVGMALLGRLHQSAQINQRAVLEYGHALGLLMRALADESESRTDAALSAVLLLAIFEVTTSRTLDSMEKWTSHMRGASLLLEMRNHQHLQRSEGLMLFVQLRFHIITGCLQRGLHVPTSVLECNRIAMWLKPQTEAHCDSIINIIGQLSNLRADIIAGVLTDAEEILPVAVALNGELLAWAADVPPEFTYTVVEDPPPNVLDGVAYGCKPYNNRYHIYHDLWVSHAWNHYRCARILTSEIIITCLRRLTPNRQVPGKILQRQIAMLYRTSKDLATDICGSAPYHLGAGCVYAGSRRKIPASQTYMGGMLLLLPLAIAAATDRRGHSMRKWVIQCLRAIGHAMGIDQAFAVIEVLETEGGPFEDLEERDGGLVYLNLKTSKVDCSRNRVLVGAWSSMSNNNNDT